ncbi:SDR family NAD(P)-dependent oxidoreductase [Humisphaera borealis]|uniref:Glucose 1-dehydrogenase n=1 Tax=Humisphaera borealis TaxID=2807512 RepID=A0A7M2X2D5_9BACT|nr:glucose 1-dehydrogenase [Humisphaera borealis]QOV91936.1 glucose 1-dehydrogenase [Humisphaera borealis]
MATSSLFRLDNKIAAVTGAGSGIGRAIALSFAEAGAAVYVLERSVDAGQAVIEEIRAAGGSATFLATDVSQSAQCQQAVGRIVAEHGRLDVLVNNAGIGHVGTILNTTEQDLDRLLAVNVKGVMFMTQAALSPMIARKAGVIVNLASIGGVVAVRDRFAYCTTKFAVVGMTKCVALDHAADGIRCNCICPGRVETPFVQARLKEYADPKQAYEQMVSTQLLKRMARPEEVAAAAIYLASDASAFVTATELILDAGWTAGK